MDWQLESFNRLINFKKADGVHTIYPTAMQETDDELLLIQQSKDGNMRAFRTIVDRHQSQIAGIVKSMVGGTPEADDVGQEVFIRLFHSLDQFKGESSLSTYLVRIAINLSLNELKRRKRRWAFFRPIEEASTVFEESTHDLKDALYHQLNELEPEFKAVVTLRMIEGYSVKETASLLEVPVGTVLSRLHRAQQKLKDVLSKKEGYGS
jgi:RNA polymerase sigma-70 factor, ECF subfamily